MNKMKKICLGGALSVCLALAGVGMAAWNTDSAMRTASAAVATEYTTVDVGISARIGNVSTENGNFNLYLTMSEIDTTLKSEYLSIADMDADAIGRAYNELGFFDKVKIGNKTLKELGCTGFYDTLGFNVDEPQRMLRLHCHADPAIWKAAVAAGEVPFGSLKVTIMEGTLIAGYTYLSGAENAVLYRSSCDFVSQEMDNFAYNRKTYGQTEIDSVMYTQAYDGNTAYLGVSLFGDDYLGDGTTIECDGDAKHFYANYENKVLINGETGKVKYYGLYNLNEGKGYYSFAVTVPEEDCQSITIPAGTMFPTRMMDGDKGRVINASRVLVVYETKTTKTFYKNAEGVFVALEDYADNKLQDLQTMRANRVDSDYFDEDVAAMDALLTETSSAFSQATTVVRVDEVYAQANAAMSAIVDKNTVKTNAINEIKDYKSATGYFRAEEETQRASIAQTATAAIQTANSKSEITAAVTTAKTAIDALKTAAQYADELLGPIKAAANAEIQNFLSDKTYLEEQSPLRAQAVENGLQAVKDAIDEEGIAQAVVQAKAAILEIPTKDDFVQKYLEELNAYKADAFRTEQAAQRAAIIAAAETDMQAATTASGMAETAFLAFAAIDALKTSEDILNEEKATAHKQVNEKKATLNYDDYSEENQAEINELFRSVKLAIDGAKTTEEVNAAAENFINAVNKLPKLGGNKGCGSNLIGISGALVLLAAAGFVAVARKKERN